MNIIRKTILGLALGAATLTTASPALADGWRGHGHRGGGDDAAIAIGAGVVGLALGAAIASNHHDRDYYYDRDYPRYRTYYYYHDYPRYPAPYYRSYYRGYDRGWHGGWRGGEWREHRGYGHGW